jgi:hypothetical protein
MDALVLSTVLDVTSPLFLGLNEKSVNFGSMGYTSLDFSSSVLEVKFSRNLYILRLLLSTLTSNSIVSS